MLILSLAEVLVDLVERLEVLQCSPYLLLLLFILIACHRLDCGLSTLLRSLLPGFLQFLKLQSEIFFHNSAGSGIVGWERTYGRNRRLLSQSQLPLSQRQSLPFGQLLVCFGRLQVFSNNFQLFVLLFLVDHSDLMHGILRHHGSLVPIRRQVVQLIRSIQVISKPDIRIIQYLPNGRLFNLALKGASWEMGAVKGLVHVVVDVDLVFDGPKA